MLIPPEKIQEVLERTDLVDLISQRVELKRSGSSLKGLCPFHGEKTPSFFVFPDKRHFKCFGCDVGGDAISFLQRLDGGTFLDVVRSLAQKAGVPLDERQDPAARERAQLQEANEQARNLWEDRLWNDPRARAGREHLAERGVSESLARAFGLGYALNSWNDLTDRLVREGILEWGSRAGLCAPRKQGEGYYDVFRGRLMIPIRSIEARTVAFGGRAVEHTERPGQEPGPKYLNSRESPLYRKGETLYALDLAKDEIRRRKTAVLVEGYFDVIGLYGAGVRNAVALCSTALTSGHLAALSRADAQELVLLLDGDAAGAKAVERLAGPILAAGARARVATLPSGDDPDEFVLREGKAALDGLIDRAPPLSTHLLDRVLPRGRASGLEEKLAALSRLKPVVEQMPAGVARSLFVAEIAGHLGVPESEIRAHLAQDPKPRARPQPSRPPAPAAAPLDPHEELFAALLLSDASLRDEPEAQYAVEVRSLELRQLLGTDDVDGDLERASPSLRASLEKRFAEIQRTLPPETRRKALQDSCNRMRLSRVEELLAARAAELQQAASDEDVARLQNEIKQLTELRGRLKPRRGG